jgi:hypothetical protein
MYPIRPTNPRNIEIKIATNTIIFPHVRHWPVRNHLRVEACLLPYSVYPNRIGEIDHG